MKPKTLRRSTQPTNRLHRFVEDVFKRLGGQTPLLTERHIYMRGKSSRVQFVVIGPTMQILLLFFVLILGSWVGYASVQTLFGTGIVAIKERQFREVQANYEQQIAEMRRSYNRLSDKNRLTQNWFLDAIARMEKRHNQLLQLLEKQSSVSRHLDTMRQNVQSEIRRFAPKQGKTQLMAANVPDVSPYMESIPPADKTTITLSLNNMQGLAANTELAIKLEETFPSTVVARVNRLNQRQQEIANTIESRLDKDRSQILTIIDGLGISTAPKLVARMVPAASQVASRRQAGIGGPYISSNSLAMRNQSISRWRPDRNGDDAVISEEQFQRIETMLDGLYGLSTTITRLPLVPPLYGAYITSGFGPRIDPFTKKSAMHSGLDFATRPGTPVHATLPGRVTYAGDRGHYGLLVEVDHGNGFRTRYAHLAQIKVQVGQRVQFQQTVGLIGSSGRSTGTHLHYEIWFDGELQDPQEFIERGQHIYALPFS